VFKGTALGVAASSSRLEVIVVSLARCPILTSNDGRDHSSEICRAGVGAESGKGMCAIAVPILLMRLLIPTADVLGVWVWTGTEKLVVLVYMFIVFLLRPELEAGVATTTRGRCGPRAAVTILTVTSICACGNGGAYLGL